MHKTRKAKEQRPVPTLGNEFYEQTRSDPNKSAGSFNQLGGFYVNGKPLNLKLRLHIIHLATVGMRACDISKYLKVSHGCVSKIITRYKETGSVNPGFIGGSKPKVATPEVVSKVADYRTRFPGIFGWEIRGKLIEDKICETKNIPSISSINRIVRTLENRDSALISELDPTLTAQTYSSFQEHNFSSSISPSQQFQSPKYSHPLSPEEYLSSPHKPGSTKLPYSATHTNKNKYHKFQPTTTTTTEADLVKPPCKYSTFQSTQQRNAKAPTVTVRVPRNSPDKLCRDSSSNSSVEGFLPPPQNWSNSTQDSGVWSDMSEPITHPNAVSNSYTVASGYKRRLSFSGLTDLSHSLPPAKRALKTSPPKPCTPISNSSKSSRKRSRKIAAPLEECSVGVSKSDNRAYGVFRQQLQVKQETQVAHSAYSSGYSLPSPPQLSRDSNLYASPSRHLMPPLDPMPLDGSSLLYPCSSLGDTAPWTHTDLLPALYNTPSPPNFTMDMGYSSNSNFSQSSSKIETSQLSSYFYPQMGQSRETDSLWSVAAPINPCYESQDAMCQMPEPFKPLSLSCSPPYLSSGTRYPSPDSTSATGTHPFYAPTRIPPPLFHQQQQQRPIGAHEDMLRMGGVSSRSLSDLIGAASHPLPTVALGEITETADTVQQDLSICPLLFSNVDASSISPPTHSPANTEVLNDPLPSTCSYPLSRDSQTGPTYNSFYQPGATDIPSYYSGNLDDHVFKN